MNYCKFFKKIKIINKRNKSKKRINEKKLIVIGILIILFIIVCIILYISQFKNKIEKNMKIIVSTFFSLIVILPFVDVIVLCGLLESLKKLIGKFEILKKNSIKILRKDSIEIIFFILLLLSGINTLNWFQKFNYVLSNLFSEFLFLICIIYILKVTILNNISKSEKWILNIGFLVIFFGVIFSSSLNKDFQTGIRITKGELKELEGGSIELFFKNGRKKFNIKSKSGELYIENDSLFKNYTIQEFVYNKENNISLFMQYLSIPISMIDKKLEYIEIEQGEFLTINNQNIKIKNKNDQIINNKINIDAKIIIMSNMNDKNNFTNYIFINNNWYFLQDVTKIKIEKDNFYHNLINLILFSFGIIYFGLKLYGKKSIRYYDKRIINRIKKTPILLDENKYNKFLTLSIFGLTIPNIWKIVTTKSIGEMNSSIWTKIDIIYLFIFSVILFCLITSKEISECVKELEKENDKNEEILNYNTKEIEKLENIEHKLDNLIFSRNKKAKNKRSGKTKKSKR